MYKNYNNDSFKFEAQSVIYGTDGFYKCAQKKPQKLSNDTGYRDDLVFVYVDPPPLFSEVCVLFEFTC